jgi:hypothetical protein
MFANFSLPMPDGAVLVLVGLLAVALGLGAWLVWRRDLRAARRCDAVPRPVSQTDPSPRHVLVSTSGLASPSAPALADQVQAKNLRGHGHLHNGPIPLRLWMTVAEVARVLPQHSVSVEVLFDARGLCIAEPDFSLALTSLLLHAAQIGRSHHIDLRPLAPEHPHYRRSASPQLLLRIGTDPEQASLLTGLGDRAIACCQLTGGMGSIETDTNLWLIWPTSKVPVRVESPSSSDEPTPPAPVCA